MKRIGIIVSILFAFIISIPIISSTSDIMNAAEETDEIKIKDIYRFDGGYNDTVGMLFAIGENGRLYYTTHSDITNVSAALDTVANFHLLTDQDGYPIENVSKVAGWSEAASPNYKNSGVALTEEGKLYAWGINNYGQFGNGNTSSEYINYAIPISTGVTDIIDVHCSYETTYLITKNGDVYASGDNSRGQYGNGTKDSSTTFVKLPITDVKKLQAPMEIKNMPQEQRML